MVIFGQKLSVVCVSDGERLGQILRGIARIMRECMELFLPSASGCLSFGVVGSGLADGSSVRVLLRWRGGIARQRDLVIRFCFIFVGISVPEFWDPAWTMVLQLGSCSD